MAHTCQEVPPTLLGMSTDGSGTAAVVGALCWCHFKVFAPRSRFAAPSFVSLSIIHRYVFVMVGTKGGWGGDSSSLLFPFAPALGLKGAVTTGLLQSNIDLCSGEEDPV